MKVLNVYGEIHKDQDRVFGIIDSIIKDNKEKNKRKKSCVLLECYGEADTKIYRENGLSVHPLETRKNKSDVTLPMKDSFKIREIDMANNIALSLALYDKVYVVVGDTHLRTISTPELGEPNLHLWLSSLKNVKINLDRTYTEIE